METTDRFVWELNLSRYSAQIYAETDSDRLDVLRNLLISEVDRFGALSERLDKADALIREARFRIERQKALVDGFDGDGRACAAAEAVLGEMRRTLELFEQHRAVLSRSHDTHGF